MTSSRDIDQQLDHEYAEAWRPEAGDKLIGRVTEVGTRNGEYGAYPIVTVKQDDGKELALHAFHTVATNELATAKPQVGEQIAVVYPGLAVAADGRSKYHAYRVLMPGRAAPTFSWSAFDDHEAEFEPDVPIDTPTADDDAGKEADDGDLPW